MARTSAFSLSDTIERLADEFASRFRPSLAGPRTVGREAEFPLVWEDGRAGEATRLWERLEAQDRFERLFDEPETRTLQIGLQRGNVIYSGEVGRGTVEMSIGPYPDLWQLQTGFEQAQKPLAGVVEEEGMWMLGFGIQPRTPASSSLMTPRKHYTALYNVIGPPWLHLTTTAADQLHVDICRPELLDVINGMNLFSGVISALCANSSVYRGRPGHYLSGREGLLSGLGEFRYGMTPRKFESLEDFVRHIVAYPCFVLPKEAGYRRYGRPFTEYIRRKSATGEEFSELFEVYLWHEHYVWNSARARTQQSTIEVRPACQQPPGEPMAASALILGLVEALPQLMDYIGDALGPDPGPAMIRYRRAVLREGLAAQEPAGGFVENCVGLAERALERRGRGEEKFLAPIWKRLEKRETPGRAAQSVMKKKGLPGLLERLRIEV